MQKLTLVLLVSFILKMNAQSKIIGKTYKTIIGMTCKDFNNGGCMIYRYCVLFFEKDSVTINYKVVPNCSPKWRDSLYTKQNHLFQKYSWRIHKNKIIINNFDEYGKLQIKGRKLIGKQEFEQQ